MHPGAGPLGSGEVQGRCGWRPFLPTRLPSCRLPASDAQAAGSSPFRKGPGRGGCFLWRCPAFLALWECSQEAWENELWLKLWAERQLLSFLLHPGTQTEHPGPGRQQVALPPAP